MCEEFKQCFVFKFSERNLESTFVGSTRWSVSECLRRCCSSGTFSSIEALWRKATFQAQVEVELPIVAWPKDVVLQKDILQIVASEAVFVRQMQISTGSSSAIQQLSTVWESKGCWWILCDIQSISKWQHSLTARSQGVFEGPGERNEN